MELLRIASEAVELATQIASQQNETQISKNKGPRDFSTLKDFHIEREVTSFLTSCTPDYCVIGEELAQSVKFDSRAWVLDPIDGTVNFSRGHPFFGISLALISHEGPLISVISLPALGRRYHAELGSGAYRGEKRLSTSESAILQRCIVSVGDFAKDGDIRAKNSVRLKVISTLASRCLRVRMHGSAAVDMCFVADGTVDANVALSNRPWDVQAGVLLVRESGGVVVDSQGSHHTLLSNSTICANPHIIDELISAIQ